MAKMKAAVEREGGGFTVFGGEALLVPKPELEELWRWGLEKYGRNSIQTNGTLQKTREATARTEAAIGRLCQEGIPPSLIVTLRRCNATPDKPPIMHEWLRRMAALGVTSARLHILEADNDYVRRRTCCRPKSTSTRWSAFSSSRPSFRSCGWTCSKTCAICCWVGTGPPPVSGTPAIPTPLGRCVGAKGIVDSS